MVGFYAGLLSLAVLRPVPALADLPGPDPRNPCDEAAARAATDVGVPLNILRAITRIETGRTQNGQSTPWPWTSNLAGRGHWYDSRAEALRELQRIQRTGETRFDVGCFQLNYRWHGDGFASLDAMLDPTQNATYAALFLQRLHAEFGDWTRAVGAYPSRTDLHANRYLARFHEMVALLPEPPAETVPDPQHQASAGPLPPFNGARRPPLWTAQSGGETPPLSATFPLAGGSVRPLWDRTP